MSNLEDLVRAGVARRREALADLDARFDEVQRAKLLSLLRRNADTEFGRAHGFDSITSHAEYREHVPPSGEADYRSAWERIRRGERGLLFTDPVHAYVLSSGTTGEPKLIPFTKALLRGLKRAVGFTTASYMARTDRFSLLRGYALQVVAPPRLRETAEGKPVGYITGLMSESHAYPFHNIGIPRAELLNIESWTEKYAAIEEHHADSDVRMMFGVPGCLLGLLRHLEQAGRPGLWPGVELIVTSGTPAKQCRSAFGSRFPGAEVLEMYLATEGAIAFQPDAAEPGMQPLAADVFFEFVPLDRWGTPSAPRLALGEVEAGVPYVILLTTPGGLYAYSPGDVVRFESTAPPRMVVEGRIGAVLSLAAEKLEAAQMELALAKTGVEYEAFSGSPAAPGAVPRHEWVIEFRQPPPADFAERLDRELCALNDLYRMSRTGGARLLDAPLVTQVRRGTFQRALERRPGQGKILPIYQDRAVRDELVAISEAL